MHGTVIDALLAITGFNVDKDFQHVLIKVELVYFVAALPKLQAGGTRVTGLLNDFARKHGQYQKLFANAQVSKPWPRYAG